MARVLVERQSHEDFFSIWLNYVAFKEDYYQLGSVKPVQIK